MFIRSKQDLFEVFNESELFFFGSILIIGMSFLMREIEAVEQVVNAAQKFNSELAFDQPAHQLARPEIALQTAFKQGFRDNRVFEGKFLSGGQARWFRTDRRAAKSLETFAQIKFEKP
jgi:hypothetical protein